MTRQAAVLAPMIRIVRWLPAAGAGNDAPGCCAVPVQACAPAATSAAASEQHLRLRADSANEGEPVSELQPVRKEGSWQALAET